MQIRATIFGDEASTTKPERKRLKDALSVLQMLAKHLPRKVYVDAVVAMDNVLGTIDEKGMINDGIAGTAANGIESTSDNPTEDGKSRNDSI